MYDINRELKLNNKEVSQMHGNDGFKRFVYSFGLDLTVEKLLKMRAMEDEK